MSFVPALPSQQKAIQDLRATEATFDQLGWRAVIFRPHLLSFLSENAIEYLPERLAAELKQSKGKWSDQMIEIGDEQPQAGAAFRRHIGMR